ncbi:hypothetical protein [Streptomyces subrutilus]|nr:hypothetical protein OG479_32910 [Streptomyces subrutilus]
MAYDQDDFDIGDAMSAEELYEDDRTAEFRLDAEDEDRYEVDDEN